MGSRLNDKDSGWPLVSRAIGGVVVLAVLVGDGDLFWVGEESSDREWSYESDS
jgi:hypothetical protein